MKEFVLARHFTLWEENNTRIRRVVFLSLVLSVALVVKVLDPFVENSEKKAPALQNIESLTDEKSVVAAKLTALERVEHVLKDVNEFIDNQPWQREKRDLIARYREMRTGFDRDSYQAEADATIENIANMLRESVVLPLRQGADIVDVQGGDLQQLDSEIESLDGFIADWQDEYTGQRWYDTIERKDRTMVDLSDSLNERLEEFSVFVTKELDAVKQARLQVDERLDELAGELAAESDRLKLIEKELEAILPKWLHGLVEIHQVIQLFPLLLLGAALYVLGTGVTLTRHYQRYADGKQLGTELTSEPAMSSTWTLIPRGRLGTPQTCLAYSLFFLVSWFLLEESITLLQAWLAIDASAAWVPSQALWDGFRWLSRLVFVGLIISVWYLPFHADRRHQAAPQRSRKVG